MAKPEQAAKPEAKKEPKGAKGAPQPEAKEKKGTAAGRRPKSSALPRLKDRYRKEILPTMMREFGYQNVMQAPQVKKVVVNIGVGEAIGNAKALDGAVKDLTSIAGQKPFVRKAKKSIATFKLREGMPVGVMVTLRGDTMYFFLDRLMSIALPRMRDFRGVPREAFDGRGNYTLGLREQLIFPEIEYDSIDKVRGMEVCIVTSARNDEEGRRLLQLMGMPFRAP
jgi:large subunit ribosomal protein L5